MFSENLKTLRKERGMSQEILAQQLHVVRQTVSKWEKGLSVPDAHLLTEIAELFEVPVSDLLGEKLETKEDVNEVAAQLAMLNQQLASRTARNRKIFRGVLIALAAWVLFCVLLVGVVNIVRVKNHSPNGALKTTALTCTLDGEEYRYEVTYDKDFRVFTSGGDGWIADHVMTEKYSNAREMIAQIEDYFTDRGGAVEIENGP